MASLTKSQMRDAGYLANLIGTLKNQQTNELRQNEMTTQQNMRRLRQNNALNGINGGFEESNYARLLAGQNQAAANIMNQYRPQLNEYQGYLDALSAAKAAAAAGGSGGSRGPQPAQRNNLTPHAAAVASAGGQDSYDANVRNAYALRGTTKASPNAITAANNAVSKMADRLAIMGYSEDEMRRILTRTYG